MKNAKALFVIGLLLVGCSSQQVDPKGELLRILEIQEAAYDDQSAENKRKFIETCTDSLIFIGGDDGGMMLTPQAFANDFADGYTRKPYDRTFQIYENTAIVNSKHQGFKLLANDTLYLNWRSTKVFVKEKGSWKMGYITYAPLPIRYDKIAQLNPAVYESYVGIYDTGTGGRDSTYIENGKLYSSGSELLPLNDSTFIGQGYFGKSIFSKTHYTFEWNDGQRIRFPKIK
jgi:hypothetical protein